MSILKYNYSDKLQRKYMMILMFSGNRKLFNYVLHGVYTDNYFKYSNKKQLGVTPTSTRIDKGEGT